MELAVLSSIKGVAASPYLTKAGAQALLGHPEASVRKVVAARDDLDTQAITTMTADADPGMRLAALTKTSDVTALIAGGKGVRARAAIARNPLTPEEVLVELSADTSSSVVRSVLKNASLPRAAALSAARRWSCADLFTSGSTAYTILDLGMAVEAHPHLAQVWVADTSTLARRVLARSPEMPEGTAERLVADATPAIAWALGGNPRARAVRARLPRTAQEHGMAVDEVLAGREVGAACRASELTTALLGSHTLDVVLSRQRVQVETLSALLVRSRKCLLEADSLARLVNNNGYEAALMARGVLGSTKILAVAQESALLSEVLGGALQRESVAHLADDLVALDEASWEALVELSSSWQGGFEKLVKAAAVL